MSDTWKRTPQNGQARCQHRGMKHWKRASWRRVRCAVRQALLRCDDGELPTLRELSDAAEITPKDNGGT